MKEFVQNKLTKYHYEFSERGNTISTKLGFGLVNTIYFHNDGSITINNELKSWNHLTGLIDMSLKSSMIYQSVSLLIATIIFSRIDDVNLPINIFLLFIGGAIYTLIWTFYYFIKAENFNKQIIEWCDAVDVKPNSTI